MKLLNHLKKNNDHLNFIAYDDMKKAKRMQEERSIFNNILKRFFNKEDTPPKLKLNLETEKGKI